MLTAGRLRELLSYNPATGVFTWLQRQNEQSRVTIGATAGSISAKGYIRIYVFDRRYFAHDLAWLWMKGEWPANQIDHRDLDKANNRWLNLRAATNKQNQENTRLRRDNKSGHKGVRWREDIGRWHAYIRHHGALRNIGYFAEKQAAVESSRPSRGRSVHSLAAMPMTTEIALNDTTPVRDVNLGVDGYPINHQQNLRAGLMGTLLYRREARMQADFLRSLLRRRMRHGFSDIDLEDMIGDALKQLQTMRRLETKPAPLVIENKP